MDSTTKDNANPIVHSVEQSERSRILLEPFQRWSSAQSVEDRAVLKALSRGNAGLFSNAGFKSNPKSHHPSYVPASLVRKQREEEAGAIQREAIDAAEVFQIIRNIQDPEHPLTLAQLNVVNRDHVEVEDNLDPNAISKVVVKFTPTIPHCSMATLIGLSLRVKLLRSLPSRFEVTVKIQPGTHASENAINKQLADKERVIAALENAHLAGIVNKCIGDGMKSSEMQ